MIVAFSSLIIYAVVGAVLGFVARRGSPGRRLRKLHVAAIIIVSILLAVLLFSLLGDSSPKILVSVAIELAFGLLWIRAAKGFLIHPRKSSTLSDFARLVADEPASTGTVPPGPLIFVSYRRDDSGDVTGRIYDRLVQHFGPQTVFKDVDSIPLGVDFREHLSASVSQCRLLLAIVGKSWVRKERIEGETGLDDPRDFVRIEIESALKRQIPVIPILVQGSALPVEAALPSSLQVLAYYNAIVVRPDPDFNTDMSRLIKGIEHHLTTSTGTPGRS